MSTVDDLSVRVTAATASFRSGMARAGSALSGLRNDAVETAGSLQILQGRMDETGDEATSLSTRAAIAGSSLVTLAGSAATAQIALDSISVLTMASLVPALLTLSTIIAPLTAALGGFAVVAGSIAGVGLVGFLGAALTNTDRLKNAFQDLTSTIQSEFAPVFDVFAGVLVNLINELTSIIPALVPAQDVVRRIATQFEALGMALIGVLPQFVDLAVTLTDQFLPPFVSLVEDVLPKVPGFFRSLIPVMQDVASTLSPLVSAISNLRPEITQFGMVVLNVIVPTLTTLTNAFGDVLTYVTQLDSGTQALVARLALLAPAVGGVVTLFGGTLAPALASAATALSGLTGPIALVAAAAAAFQQDLAGIRTTTMRVVGVLRTELVGAFQQLRSTVGPIIRQIAGAWNGQGSRMISVASMLVSTLGDELIVQIRKLGPITARITSRISALWNTHGGAILRMVNLLSTNLSEGLISAMAAVTAALEGDWVQMRSMFRQGSQSLLNIWNAIWPRVQLAATAAFDYLTNALPPKLAQTFNALVAWLNATGIPMTQQAFGRLGTQALAALNFTQNQIVPPVRRGLNSAWAWVRTEGVTLAVGALSFLVTQALGAFQFTRANVVPPVRRGLNQAWNWVRTNGVTLAKQAFSQLVTLAMNAVDFWNGSLQPALQSAFNSAKAWVLGPGLAQFKSVYRTLGRNIYPTILDALGLILQAFQVAVPRALDWVQQNGPKMTEATFFIIGRAIRNTILGMFAIGGIVGQAFVSGMSGVIDWLQSGGATRLKNAFVNIITGLVSYMRNDALGNIKAAAAYMFNGLMTAFNAFARGFYGQSIPDMFNSVVSYIRGVDIQGAMFAILNDAYLWLTNSAAPQIVGVVDDMMSDVLSSIESIDVVGTMRGIFDGAGSAASSAFTSAFNRAIPSSVGIDPVTVAGQEVYGGGSINLPQLDTGGYIESGGFAQLHSGEQVLTAAQVDRRAPRESGGTTEVELDHSGLADAIARTLGGSAIQLDTDDDELRKYGIEGAEIVIEEERKDVQARRTR